MAKRLSPIRRVFHFLWRTILFIYAAVSVVALLAVPLILYFVLAGKPVEVEEDIALVWSPVGDLVEESQQDVRRVLMREFLGDGDRETTVRGLIESLEQAAEDPRIKLTFLNLDRMEGATPGQLQDLAAAIQRFRESGKRVIAWAPTFNQSQYFLAAQADEVYLDPMGYIFLEGYGVYRKYFKDAIDKLGVEINVFRVGEYKSFVEPFTRNDMSPEARAANRAWLDSLWQSYVDETASPRGLTTAAVKDYIAGFEQAMERTGGDAAEVALQAGLVDGLLTQEEMRDKVREWVGTQETHGSFRQISHFEYLHAVDAGDKPNTESRIGLVVVEGPIVAGEGMPDTAGGERIARRISEARRDDHVSALVLRVNSPGGAIYPSEQIRREVAMMRDAGKPVVVSMAGVAASGGYWVSMNANQIWAQPSTITGSIGVFGLVPTYAEPLDKIGVHTDGLGTTALSGALRGDRPLSPEIKTILQTGIEHAYDEFVGRVAEARGMSVEAVMRVAQGRVWSGSDAKRIGLVDQLGGFRKAVEAAADLAGLKPGDYRLETVHPPGGWRRTLQDLLSLRASTLPHWLTDSPWAGELAARLVDDPVFDWVRHGLNDPRGRYAHCLCELSQAQASP